MLSCDTIAFTAARMASRRNMLAKNSDRPLGEAQPLVFIEGGEHPAGEMLQCTHLTIPQAPRTYSVLGSKPYWIWGFEMGANEKGLYIGNEAQGSRCKGETEEGLLGMDLLRLALERAATAREAITVLSALLRTYGQNANANVRYDRRYENSFILVDPSEVWVMETAGREWAAKKIDDFAACSNCYTIETDYDLCSDGMEALVRENRWVAPTEPVNFAKAFTLGASRQTNSVPRKRRLDKLVRGFGNALTERDVKSIFRDHFEDEINAPRFGACNANFVSICMHAQDANAAQTAASMLFTYDDVFGPVFRYAPSMPCCSVFIPVYWTGHIPEMMTSGGRYFEENSLWWNVEKLASAVTADEERFGEMARSELQKLEELIEAKTSEQEAVAKTRIAEGCIDDAVKTLDALTAWAASMLMLTAKRLAGMICLEVRRSGGLYGPRKEFLEEYCQWAKMSL